MRIAFVINAMGRGGAEIQVKDYALRFTAQGNDVLLVSLLPCDEFEDELRRAGVQVETLGMTKGRSSVRAGRLLVRLLQRFEPEIIHAHMFAAIIAARLARAALLGLRVVGGKAPPLVDTAHTPFELNKGRYMAYRLTNPLSNLWTCVCRDGIEEHERHGAVPPGAGVMSVNGIDTRAFAPDAAVRAAMRRKLGLSADEVVWLTAGSFRDEQKDYTNLLQAFATVRREFPLARLLIAGTGVLFDAKRAEAIALGLEESVRFLGLRSDVASLLRAADAFVLGSAWEAMPIVLLEAAASSLPTVCTDVGQNSDLVVPGGGHLVPPKDPERLADAMGRIMRGTEEERRRMGEALRAHVASRYDLDVIVEQWRQRYADLIARAS